MLTIFFVMLAEVLIFTPSAGRYRAMYLQERRAGAHLAGLALEATPSGQVSPALEAQLLRHVAACGIAVHLGPFMTRMLGNEIPPAIDHVFNLDRETPMVMILRAFEAIRRADKAIIRITRRSPSDPSVLVSIIMAEAPMRAPLIDYSRGILELYIIISLITACLVYFSLQWLMVRPLGRLMEAITDLHALPEDADRDVKSTQRRDEIGLVEWEFAEMRQDLRQALAQKKPALPLWARLSPRSITTCAIFYQPRSSYLTGVRDSDDPEVPG